MDATPMKGLARSIQKGPTKLDVLASWFCLERRSGESLEDFFDRYNDMRESIGMHRMSERDFENLKNKYEVVPE